jgi:ATP-dependent phosphoenolpyruvate carboxykinase
MSTRDLINAIADGEATEVETSFNNIMAAKVSEKLDAMRTDMAQNMFQTVSQAEEESDDFDSEVTDEAETFEDEPTAEENE